MTWLIKNKFNLSKSTPTASRVLIDYSYWLNKHYGRFGNYLTNAKTFLKTLKNGGTVISQLQVYMDGRSLTMQSILRRLSRFIEENNIRYIINDLDEKALPIANIYVKIFLLHRRDRLRGDKSIGTYATVLNQYFNFIKNDLTFFNKKTAEKFIHAPTLSDYTKRLYKSILKNFCDWALIYQGTLSKDLSKDQLVVKKGLLKISTQSLREISDIRVPTGKNQTKRYHKDTLDEKQRNGFLKLAESKTERAVIALMAWNGLRKIEIIRASVNDCNFKDERIAVWGKGRTSRNKEWIKLFAVPKNALTDYIQENKIKSGRLFPGISESDIENMIYSKFEQLKLIRKGARYSPHSLRHTAGQIMYDKGIPLEFIQKTLRHSSMETTLMYAQKAIDKQYFKKMPACI